MLSRRDLVRSVALAAIAPATSRFGAAGEQTSTDHPGLSRAKDIAQAGFIYGLPIVMNYGAMYEFAVDRSSKQFKVPFNQITHEAKVFTYKDTTVPTPNSDTPYSVSFMDLRAEPVVLSVPAVEKGRYYSVQLCDGNTYNYGYIGSRATGNEAGDFMVVGPYWEGDLPAGIRKMFRSSTQFASATYRTQLFSADDLDNVKRVQAGYTVQTLSAFLKHPEPPPSPSVSYPKFSRELLKTNFFDFLDFALQFSPAQANERDIRAQLARIGVGGGKTFNFNDLSLADQEEIKLGISQGERKIHEAMMNAGTDINGWRVSSLAGGDSTYFNGDWLKRATVAKVVLYANDAEEATYPITRVDSDGQTLDGSQHNYTLTFSAGQQPPVDGFWSIAIYDGVTQLLIKNPINRYLISSHMIPAMKTNADGSLTVYIQNQSPGAGKEANWLPAPNGPIYLVMRLYWPKTTPPSILPAGEGTWRPPGVKRVS